MATEIAWIGWSECVVCGRVLSDADSVQRGAGLRCWTNHGLEITLPDQEVDAREKVAKKLRKKYRKTKGRVPNQCFVVTGRDGKVRPISNCTTNQLVNLIEDDFPKVVEARTRFQLKRLGTMKLKQLLRELIMLNNTRPAKVKRLKGTTESGVKVKVEELEFDPDAEPEPEEDPLDEAVGGNKWGNRTWREAAQDDPDALAASRFKGERKELRDRALAEVLQHPGKDPESSDEGGEEPSKDPVHCAVCDKPNSHLRFSSHDKKFYCHPCWDETFGISGEDIIDIGDAPVLGSKRVGVMDIKKSEVTPIELVGILDLIS